MAPSRRVLCGCCCSGAQCKLACSMQALAWHLLCCTCAAMLFVLHTHTQAVPHTSLCYVSLCDRHGLLSLSLSHIIVSAGGDL